MSQRILAVLGESPLPISTPDLTDLVAAGLSCPSQRVWVTLRALRKKGLIVNEWGRSRKARTDQDGQRVAMWRLA